MIGSATLGALEIKLLADVAQLRADMGSASGIVSSASEKMSAGFGAVSRALAAVGVGLSVAGFTSWVKSAINAGDEMKAFSQKTGVAVKDVAGLQLAFKQGGVESAALEAALARMTREMSNGNTAFKTLGVSTHSAGGELRSANDVLVDTAEALAGVKNDTERSALAMDIFGKSGSALLPVFEDGAAGLKEMADMADKLGLSMSEEAANAADSFNDTLELLGAATEGVGRQVAAYLLPALNDVVGAFLEFVTEGDRVQAAADGVATALKGLYSGGVLLVTTLQSVGKALGAVFAGVTAVMNGDFKAAMNIGGQWVDDMKTDWKKAIENIGTTWDGSAGKSTRALTSLAGGLKNARDETDKHETATKKNKEQMQAAKAAIAAKETATKNEEAATKKAREEYEKYATKLDAAIDEVTRATGETGKKTEAQKLEEEWTKKVKDQTILATEEQKQEVGAKVALLGKLELEKTARLEQEARLNAVYDELAKQYAAQWEEVRALESGNAELQTQLDKLGLNETQLVDYEAALLKAKAEQLELKAAEEGGNAALAEQARLLRERAGLLVEGVAVKEALAAKDAWEQTTTQIQQGLTDSLYDAFESGKDFFDTFWTGLKNTFKTTVLRLLIDPVMRPINAAIGTLLGGMAGPANAAGGGMLGGLGDIFSGMGTIGGMMGGAGGLFGAGAGMTMSGGMGAALEAAGAALGNGSIMGGLAIGAGALAPIALGAGLLYSMLRKERTPHTGGAATATALGGSVTPWATATGDGGWVARSDEGEASALAMAGGVAGMLQPLATLGGLRGRISVATGFADDTSGDGAWGTLRINAGGRELVDWNDTRNTKWAPRVFGDGAAGYDQYVQAIATDTLRIIRSLRLPEWAADITAGLKDGATLEQIGEAVEQLQKVSNIRDVFSGLSRFGGIFDQIANSGDDAAVALTDMLGGIEGLTAAANAYIGGYYSQDERMAIQAKQVVDALKDAGVNVGSLRTRADYRSALETINPSADNMGAVAAMLRNAGLAGEVFDYLGTLETAPGARGKTLFQLSQDAPAVTVLDSLTTAQDDLKTAVTDGNVAVKDAVSAMHLDVAAILGAIAASSASTARQLTTWDDGGALATTSAV